MVFADCKGNNNSLDFNKFSTLFSTDPFPGISDVSAIIFYPYP